MKAETQCAKSNLGLVCITTTDAVRYKTVTRKRLLSFDEKRSAKCSARFIRKTSTASATRLNFAGRTASIFTG
jgi:hypothetical protein